MVNAVKDGVILPTLVQRLLAATRLRARRRLAVRFARRALPPRLLRLAPYALPALVGGVVLAFVTLDAAPSSGATHSVASSIRASTSSNDAGLAPEGGPPQSPIEESNGPGTRVQVTRDHALVWPATGGISSYFGPYHTQGIDIALDLENDSPIHAAGAGTVSFAGGNVCCSYGYYVVIDHANGRSTLYGHFSKIYVTEGQEVQAGDVLGLGGATGEATGKHLHFEVHEDDTLVDPFRYLPAVQNGWFGPDVETVSCPATPITLDPDTRVTLRFLSSDLEEAHVAGVTVRTISGPSVFALPAASVAGALKVSLDVPPSANASGVSVGYLLDATLQKGDEEQTLSCPLGLQTLKTLANPPPARRVGASPTPKATSTALPASPTPRKPAGSPTPFRGTPTLTPIPGLPPTSTPVRGGVTPTTPAKALPTATKKP